MKLAELQSFLAGALRRWDSLGDDAAIAARVREIASGNDRLSPVEQADIYREQFWLRHRDVMYDDYPGLAYWLDEEAFERFVRAYLDACPPCSWTLRDLGADVPRFAASWPGFAEDRRGPAIDLARFEHAFVDAFDGPDVPPLAVERIAALPPEAWASARVVLHPLLTLLELAYPVHKLRRAVKRGDEPARSLEPKPTWIALYRGDDLKVHYRSMQEQPFRLLALLHRGEPLVEACDALASRVPPPERDALGAKLQGWFRDWAIRGWIADVIVAPLL